MLELIYENEYCSARYDRDKKQVRTQYVGIVIVDKITDLLRRVMDFSGKEQIVTMVADLSKMQGTFTGALDFFEKEFYPTMIKNGLHSYACALSKDAFTKFAASQLKKKVGGKLEWHAFSDLQEADRWMHSQIDIYNNLDQISKAS